MDYGAGKCKIANALSKITKTYVFDVDMETVHKRVRKDVTIIPDIEETTNKFDFINCNKVLCCTDENTNRYITNRIHGLLKKDGVALFSICNPFFEDVDKTETRRSGYHGEYENVEVYHKDDIFVGREEYHRPLDYYVNLFGKSGLKIIDIKEDEGLNIDTINFIGEHMFFLCKKSKKTILEDCSLLIKSNPMEHNSIFQNVVHIVNQLQKGVIFKEIVLVIDGKKENRVRAYDTDDEEAFNLAVSRLLADGFVDRAVHMNESKITDLYNRYFKEEAKSQHSRNGQPIFATLCGFEAIKTRYVYQTDSDILFFNDGTESLLDALQTMKTKQATSLCLSIASENDGPISFGSRVEVRSCFLDLEKLRTKLPLNNQVCELVYDLPWHRALDNCLNDKETIRLKSSHLFFIHPENRLKKIPNFLAKVRRFIEKNLCFIGQISNVNLQGNPGDWVEKTTSEMIVFIRGRNTEPEKLKRLFKSIKAQSYKNFQLVYVDDASSSLSREYAKTVLMTDPFFFI